MSLCFTAASTELRLPRSSDHCDDSRHVPFGLYSDVHLFFYSVLLFINEKTNQSSGLPYRGCSFETFEIFDTTLLNDYYYIYIKAKY